MRPGRRRLRTPPTASSIDCRRARTTPIGGATVRPAQHDLRQQRHRRRSSAGSAPSATSSPGTTSASAAPAARRSATGRAAFRSRRTPSNNRSAGRRPSDGNVICVQRASGVVVSRRLHRQRDPGQLDSRQHAGSASISNADGVTPNDAGDADTGAQQPAELPGARRSARRRSPGTLEQHAQPDVPDRVLQQLDLRSVRQRRGRDLPRRRVGDHQRRRQRRNSALHRVTRAVPHCHGVPTPRTTRPSSPPASRRIPAARRAPGSATRAATGKTRPTGAAASSRSPATTVVINPANSIVVSVQSAVVTLSSLQSDELVSISGGALTFNGLAAVQRRPRDVWRRARWSGRDLAGRQLAVDGRQHHRLAAR